MLSQSQARFRPTLLHADRTDEDALASLLKSPRGSVDARGCAKRLLQVFGNLPGIQRASTRELMALEGIGPVTVARIRSASH